MPFNIFGANSVSGYTVKNSLRFNVGSSDYLIRTISSTGSSQKFTASGWIKRSQFGASSAIYCSSDSSLDYNFRSLFINADDRVQCGFYVIASGYTFQVETSALLRDPSAWYHIVTSVDTTQSTASDRVKIYINGVLQTSFSTANYPSLNATINFSNSGYKQLIASLRDGSSIFNGCYLAEIYVLDGITKTASDFGETDTDTGIWKPKAYTGTYGTNGFYLKFADSASLGTDSSGNGNNFTVNNLTSIDQTTDTPSNNWCTLNPLDNGNSNILTSNGNNSVSSSTTWDRGIKATFGISSGKWYWEYKHGTVNSGTNPAGDLGITKYSSLINSASNGGATNSESYFIGGADGSKYNGSYTPTSYGSAFTTGDIAMLALDMDNGKFYMGKNGTWFNSGNPATSTNPAFTSLSGTFFPVWYWGISAGTGGVLISDFNFGNPPYSSNAYQDANGFGNFSYAVPSGFYSLCTKNLYQYGF